MRQATHTLEAGRVITAAGPHKRFDAQFNGRAFAPHRHDTYTFALTTTGVQSFEYRGASRHSLPGELVILHPDELHDGQAGTDDAFGYRGLNIRPQDFADILDGQPLPFLEGGRTTDRALIQLIFDLVVDLSTEVDAMDWQSSLTAIVDRMRALETGKAPDRPADPRAVRIARDYILDNLDQPISMDELEQITGRSRWNLARDFKTLLGTSPYRYVTLRRLDQARIRIAKGEPLAQTACATGFADQAHLTRQFKAAFGLTPKAWHKILDFETNGTIIQ